MPVECSSLWNRMWWSMVSNAALRSNKTSTERSSLSDAVSRSSVTFSSSKSRLKPAVSSTQCSVMETLTWWKMMPGFIIYYSNSHWKWWIQEILWAKWTRGSGSIDRGLFMLIVRTVRQNGSYSLRGSYVGFISLETTHTNHTASVLRGLDIS